MKKEAKGILDKERLKGKVKFYTIFAIPILIFSVLLIVFYPISSSNLIVTAYKYTAKQTDFGNTPIMWVKLSNNATIKVTMPNNVKLQHDRQAEIIKTNTLIGVSTYKFVRYVN